MCSGWPRARGCFPLPVRGHRRLLIAALTLGGVLDPVTAFALLGLTLAAPVMTSAGKTTGAATMGDAVSSMLSTALLAPKPQPSLPHTPGRLGG